MKEFSINHYKKLFRQRNFISLIKLLKESGIVQKTIDENPKLKASEKRYLGIAESIINFPKTNKLLS